LDVNEQRIDLSTDGGVMDCYVRQPDGKGAWPAVVFYMDALGIRPDLLGMAHRLASHGYVVIVPNLYYRTGPHAPFDPGAAFTEGPERDRMLRYLRAIDNALVMKDTAACLEFLRGQKIVAQGPVACVGYCMGGRQALMAAGTFPDTVAVAASFHGAALATERPDSPHLLAPAMRARVYIGVAAIDHNFSPEEKQRLVDALEAGGVRYTLETYPDARHGFAVTGHPVYDRAASERHWATLIDFLNDAFKPVNTSARGGR
jgi:carboxymethylenebutenolidase